MVLLHNNHYADNYWLCVFYHCFKFQNMFAEWWFWNSFSPFLCFSCWTVFTPKRQLPKNVAWFVWCQVVGIHSLPREIKILHGSLSAKEYVKRNLVENYIHRRPWWCMTFDQTFSFCTIINHLQDLIICMASSCKLLQDKAISLDTPRS